MAKQRCCLERTDSGCPIHSCWKPDQRGVDRPDPHATERFLPSPVDRVAIDIVELGAGALHATEANGTCRIACVEGTLWVTSRERPSDYLLKAGEHLLLRRRSKVLLSACGGGARIQIGRS